MLKVGKSHFRWTTAALDDSQIWGQDRRDCQKRPYRTLAQHSCAAYRDRLEFVFRRTPVRRTVLSCRGPAGDIDSRVDQLQAGVEANAFKAATKGAGTRPLSHPGRSHRGLSPTWVSMRALEGAPREQDDRSFARATRGRLLI